MFKAIALSALAFASGPSTGPSAQTPKQQQVQVAVMCFSQGEQISGMNKICYYDCLGSAAAITISSVQLCPLSINR